MPPHPPTTELNPRTTPLPTTTPHLMPFHIAHTGPAPLSTYFLVRPAPPPPGASLAQRAKARFVAAFRGRTIQGLAVPLPHGFSGVVLRAEDGKRREGELAKKRRRSARHSQKDHVDDDENEDFMMGDDEEAEADAAKVLRPTAEFTSFTLWNPDVNVDEEMDEYLRFLAEYQRLSAEIHRIP